MLFRKEFLHRIRDGTVTLAFRTWRRPTVRAGGTLLTPVGELSIVSVVRLPGSTTSSAVTPPRRPPHAPSSPANSSRGSARRGGFPITEPDGAVFFSLADHGEQEVRVGGDFLPSG